MTAVTSTGIYVPFSRTVRLTMTGLTSTGGSVPSNLVNSHFATAGLGVGTVFTVIATTSNPAIAIVTPVTLGSGTIQVTAGGNVFPGQPGEYPSLSMQIPTSIVAEASTLILTTQSSQTNTVTTVLDTGAARIDAFVNLPMLLTVVGSAIVSGSTVTASISNITATSTSSNFTVSPTSSGSNQFIITGLATNTSTLEYMVVRADQTYGTSTSGIYFPSGVGSTAAVLVVIDPAAAETITGDWVVV